MKHHLTISVTFGDTKDLSVYFQLIKDMVKHHLTQNTEETSIPLMFDNEWGGFDGTIKIDKE